MNINLRKWMKSTMTTIADRLKQGKMSEKSIGILLRSFHLMVPCCIVYTMLYGSYVYCNATLVLLLFIVGCFYTFEICFLSVLEQQLCKDDFVIVDPMLELCEYPINIKNRYYISNVVGAISKQMLSIKYKPDKLEQFVGNKHVIQPFVQWLLEWNTNYKQKCLLVSGPTGVGKSLLVELILRKYNYHAIFCNAFEFNKEIICQSKTLSGQKNCLVIYDMESTLILECIKETHIPIICICDDRYHKNIKPLLPHCFDIQLTKPSDVEVGALIRKVAAAEKICIKLEKLEKLEQLIEESNGDIRFLLNNLPFITTSIKKDIQSLNIFDTTGFLLSQEPTLDEKINYFWMAANMHPLMIQENYINNTLTRKVSSEMQLCNLSDCANSLSDADILQTTLDYNLSPYVAWNVLRATTKCTKKGQIKFSQYFGKMNRNKNNNDKNNNKLDCIEKAKVEKAKVKVEKASGKSGKSKSRKGKSSKSKKTLTIH